MQIAVPILKRTPSRSLSTATVPAILHTPSSAPRVARGVVMVAGAGGGVSGPSGMYPELGRRFSRVGVYAIQLDYRYPNRQELCVEDLLSGIAYLKDKFAVSGVVVLGWSFGGAVVIDAGARSDLVRGVATVASQTAGTDGVTRLNGKSLLLMHGTGDTCLSPYCSRQLFARASEPKELVLFERDDHGLTRNAPQAMQKFFEWSLNVLEVSISTSTTTSRPVPQSI